MKQRAQELVEQGDRLFSKRSPLLPLWQTIAEHFYPIRADFTSKHSLGDEFASHLMTGRPALVHRDLSNAFSSMLRPRGQAWFHPRTNDEQINEDAASRAFLDDVGAKMLRAMYEDRAGFVRATKEGDHDFAAFGQTVIEVRPNRYKDGLLFLNRHLRDSVWCENAERQIDVFHLDHKLEAREYVRLFPETAAQAVKSIVAKEPYKEIKCRHIVIPSDDYDLDKIKNKQRFPFVSLYVDVDNQVVLEEVPRRRLGYVIPRWQTIPGLQYAFSPCTIIAIPDARMLQQITLTLIEAGQKAVDPPLKAVKDIVGTVNTYPGGITWVDEEYDERMGAALEPLIAKDNGALSWGQGYQEKIEALLNDMFFLSKLTLPPTNLSRDMTAYEAGQRVQEYIRNALPLFEPMEVEYNGGLCAEIFNVCMDLNLFGPKMLPENMPPALRGQEIRWEFDSPLQEAIEKQKVTQFLQAANLTQIAVGADPGMRHDFDVSRAYRDAMLGAGPSDWLVPEDVAAKLKAEDAKAAMAAQIAQTVGAGADIANKVGAGMQQLQAAGVPV